MYNALKVHQPMIYIRYIICEIFVCHKIFPSWFEMGYQMTVQEMNLKIQMLSDLILYP